MLSLSEHILHQLVHIIVHVADPELGVRFIDLLWYRNHLVKPLFVYLLLLQLFLCRIRLFNKLVLLLGLHCDWLSVLLLGLWLFWLELRFWTMSQEISIGWENILLLEHNIVGRVLLYLITSQTSVCLCDVCCYQGVQYFLKFRSLNKTNNYFF